MNDKNQSSITDDDLNALYQIILSRKNSSKNDSYTASLLTEAPEKPARKLCEEATELLIEALADDRPAMIRESADLLYHLLVVWAAADIHPKDVLAELASRRHQSGHDEKRNRSK